MKVPCVKLVLKSIVAQKGTNMLFLLFSNMVLNMVLNEVLNLVLNSISSWLVTLSLTIFFLYICTCYLVFDLVTNIWFNLPPKLYKRFIFIRRVKKGYIFKPSLIIFIVERSSRTEMFLGKGVLKTRCKFTGEFPCWSVISIKLQSNFIEMTLCHRCSPVTLLHILRTPFPKNTPGRLLLCWHHIDIQHRYTALQSWIKYWGKL